MTVYLALDPVDGLPIATTGLIRVIGNTAVNARLALVAAGLSVFDYTGNRFVSIDETDDSVWNINCEPGWFIKGGVVQQHKPLTDALQVAVDIRNFKESVEREAVDWQQVLAEENFNPHFDSGHSWSSDLLHSLIVPNIRGLVVLLQAAKATPNAANIMAYRARHDSFIAISSVPGILNIYRDADKSVWRPKRDGARAYGYDVDTGGVRQFDHDNDPLTDDADVAFDVTYPNGETVATWSALDAVRSL